MCNGIRRIRLRGKSELNKVKTSGFQGDPTTKERTDKMLQSNLAAIALEVSDSGASGMEQLNPARGAAHSHEPTRPSYAGGHFELRSRGHPRQHLLHDHGTGEGSEYYRNDLSEQDVLELIPRGLGLVQVEDGYWLCCRYCTRKQNADLLPETASHFRHSRHNPPPQPASAMTVSPGPQAAPPLGPKA